MGITYSAAIVVGLPIDEMEHGEGGYWDDEGILEHIPNYYDSQEGIVGVYVASSGDYSFREIDTDIDVALSNAKEEFKRITGKNGKAYITCRGS